ncbi:MAG: antitoxin VbhA family protein [Alphaproteobacteria bacterium]|nr:antitoxin VbhA family protein [Alphaproteobacteria bacterium]
MAVTKAKSAGPSISEQERAARKAAYDFARGSVRLEGFVLSDEAEALIARYLDGQLTREQMNDEVRMLAFGHGR